MISVAVLAQILLPFVLWGCARCRTSCKEVEEEEDDQRRRYKIEKELGRRMQRVATAGNQEELDQSVQEYQQAVQDYQKQSEAKELSRKQSFYRNASLCRLISMDMFFSFYLWLIYFVGCDVSQCTKYGSVFEMLRILAIVMLCLSPVIVLLESAFSRELNYLKNIMEDETAWEYLQRMHEVPPRINMVVECYHNETRTRVVHYTDSSGNQQSSTETYTKKVVTYVDTDVFSFGSWLDISKKEMPALSTVALTRVKIDLSMLFGDQETADDYERQVTEMLERNRHRDVCTDYSSSKEIPGLKERISAYVDLKVKPFWIRPLFFWIATLLLMTWPYRWLFRAKTAKTYYTLKKKMYKSAVPPREADVMDPFAFLTANILNSSSNNCAGYPVSVMSNPGGDYLIVQNDGMAYPPVNPYFQRGDPSQAEGHLNLPPQSDAEQPFSSYPPRFQPSAPPPTCAVGMDYQAPYPAFQGNPAGPLPRTPPPSYEEAVGHIPQPRNEHEPPSVQC